MDQNYSTTDTLHKKGAHLTFEERVIIQTRLRDNQSYRSIAREIGCCVNTVRNEVKRGSLDACFGRALVTGEFQRDEMVCTKTLYNYVTLGLLGKIKSIDLPLRVKRKTPGSGFVSVRRSSAAV